MAVSAAAAAAWTSRPAVFVGGAGIKADAAALSRYQQRSVSRFRDCCYGRFRLLAKGSALSFVLGMVMRLRPANSGNGISHK
jgi:hypothetical protein